MAANIKGLTVEIGGDTTSLGKALEDVNKKSRDLSSELYQIEKALKLDPGNVELLAQKQKVLSEAISTTSEKLDKLKTAEKQVQEQFERGEVSEEQVRALQREIITTESKLNSYEKQAKEAADQIDKLGDESEESEKDVDELGDEAEQTGKQLDDAGDKASSFGDKVKVAGAVAAAGLAAVTTAAGAAVTALAGASVEAAAYADDMLTMSTITGMSTDDLQAFTYAAGLLDVEVETISKSLAKNTKSMASAADGSAAYAEAYEKLGVSVTDADGNLRDSETVYWEAIDALGQLENETERDAIAMQLFGKSAQELNPLIEAGSEAVNELKQEAKDVGAVLSEDTLDVLGSFDDSIQRLQGSAGAAKNSLGGVLLPELQMLTDAGTDLLTKFTKKLNASGGGLEGLVSTVDDMSGEIVDTITSLATELLGKVADLAPTLVSVAMSLVTSLTTTLISMLPQLITTGIEIIMALIQGLTQAIPQVVQAIMAILPQLVSALVMGIPQLIQGAVQLLLAIVQAIPQIIPPLVAALPIVVTTIINALLQATPQLIDGALQFLLAIVDAIPLLIEALAPMIPEIVTTIIEGLISCLPALLDGAVQLLNAIIDAIPVIIQALIPQIPTIVNTIIDCLLNNLPILLDAAVELFMALVKAIPQVVGALARELPTIVKTIMGVLKTLPGKVLSVGKDLVTGLWNGVKDKLSWIKEKLSGFTSSVLDGIKEFFGVHSPSTETAWIGEMLDRGLAEGVLDNMGKPIDAMQQLSSDMLGEADALNGMELERNLHYSASAAQTAAAGAVDNSALLAKLDGIYERLGRLQVVMNGRAVVGEIIDEVDAALAGKQVLSARGV